MTDNRRAEEPAVILTHDNADFDAIAGLVAASRLFPEATPVLPARLNRNVREFLSLYADALRLVEARHLPRQKLAVAILVDTQSASPVRGMRPRTRLHVIDHHPRSESLPETAIYEDAPVGAVTTLLVERLRERGVELLAIEASLLLLGIHEDTGSLTYQGTTPRDAMAAAWLLEQGASLEIVETFLRAPLMPEQHALFTRLINEAEVVSIQERSILIAAVHLEHYVEELAAVVHKLVDLFDPDAAFLLAEYGGAVQVIARSTTGAIDVGDILRHLQGGGHAKAAAGVIEDSDLDAVRDQLLDLLRVSVQPEVTVSQIMSYGVHTLSPDLTITDANARMRRYGHEGFPVVEGGRLVGVLTRSEIDKALHHDLGAAPVRAYMRTGAVSVSPQDPVSRVQQIMMEHDLGQVPVVSHGQVLGIVTRTDLIKLWSAPRPSRQAQIASLLDRTLPESLLELLHQARDEANDMGYSLYVVGGFVRDLLLGKPTLDVDLVVEGNAISLARRLAQTTGSRVRSHGRFGTAKLILEEPREPGLPPTLDFVTARTEFYAHPSALPQVERSSIKQDLYRRDFTINTMAISLDRARYGELLDYYGGERDLHEGLIRVLHSLSFVEDPTRMLRAVRFEQRLGFEIEERTEDLLRSALDLLDRVSGDRLRNELLLILREPEPERAWARLHELGILSQLSPALQADGWATRKLQELRRCCNGWARKREAGEPVRESAWPSVAEGHVPCDLLALAILTMRLGWLPLERLLQRLSVPRNQAALLADAQRLYRLLPQLTPDISGSALAAALRAFPEGALFVAWVAADDPIVRDLIVQYQCRLRLVRPAIDGRRLRELGLKPGPKYGRILDALRDARLDGVVNTVEEEEALLQELVAAQAESAR
jgi:tRNA nucleotidyltransferase (CCA-adding enzyme)